MLESLPDELFMEILMRLSADEIYDNARLVCRSDAFVYEHLHRASSGLLLEPLMDLGSMSSPILVTATMQGRVEISKLSCTIDFPILCSCNGLALCLRRGAYRDGGTTPFIFNPATKCAFNLPRVPIKVGREELIYKLVMAYAAASMEYKVVRSYCESGRAQCGILTVGVDKTWRHVAVEDERMTCLSTPLTTRGFVHWVSETHVVSLNVETETLTLTPTPPPVPMFLPNGKISARYLLTGEYLSLLIRLGYWSWEFWEMKPETWEWRKVLPCLDLEAHKCKIQQFALHKSELLKPVGWVRYPKVLAFLFNVTVKYCIIYNLDTEEFESIELSTAKSYRATPHTNSLVWSEKF